MAIHFATNAPEQLRTAFDKAIDAGKIETWERDADGDYTHKADRWKGKAWLRATVGTGKLSFHFVPVQDTQFMRPTFAYYQGHLIETFTNHFSSLYSSAVATATPAPGDNMG